MSTEQKEKLDRLRARRGGHRGVSTKLAKEASELLQTPEGENIERCEIIAIQLEEKLVLLTKLDEEILNICDVTEIQGEIEESAVISDRILEIKRKIDKQTKAARNRDVNIKTNVSNDGNLNLAAGQENTSNAIESAVTTNTMDESELVEENTSQNSGEDQPSPQQPQQTITNTTSTTGNFMSSLPKLPKLELPKFAGRITEWNAFWDLYDSAIHSNPSISKVNKFNYLQSLLEGNASRAIKGLTLTGANYDAAVQILRERFGKTQQSISAHMDEILKIQACMGSKPSQLRYVFDKISVHVRGLETLGVSSEQYGSMLIPIIMSKLPNDICLEIARKSKGDVWKIDDLLNTIKLEIEAREVSEGVRSSHQQQGKRPGGQPTVGAFVTKGKNPDNFRIRCVYCEEPHYSASCEKVVSSEDRKTILRNSNRCYNCLRKGHLANACANTKKCRNCSGKHHQSICSNNSTSKIAQKQTQEEKNANETKTDGEQSAATLTRVGKGSVLLQTARAVATNGSRTKPVRILFDTGSQLSYVTNDLAKQLKLTPVKRETLHLNTFGNSKTKRENCDVFKFNIRSTKGHESIELRAVSFPTICSPVSSVVNIQNYPHLRELDLADLDESGTCNNRIDILIGADFYWRIVTGDVVRRDNGPTAISSKLGWLLSGPSTKNSTYESTTNNLVLAGESIDNSHLQTDGNGDLTTALKRFWETESIGIRSIEEADISEANNFLKDIRFTGERYEVGLPWIQDRPEIESDYDLCYNRLKLLHHKLKKQPELLVEYNKCIEDQIQAGIVEEVPSSEDDKNKNEVHYLPHHGVVRNDKVTTKLRVVYDGSATTADRGYSLNDCLLTGPNYIPQIFEMLVKFRVNPVGLVADIEKAFLMVGISEKDRDMLRFLWFKNIESHDPELVQLRFCRLVFGLRPSPAILGATINQHLDTTCCSNKIFNYISCPPNK